MNIKVYSFNQLSTQQLYALIKLRVDVFVVEQNCAYEELDNRDQEAIHLLGMEVDELITYARIVFSNDHLHIGRIVTKQNRRNKGVGSQILDFAIQYCENHNPCKPIHLSAQHHLTSYYQRFGFKPISPTYDWDGILHVDMIRE